MINGTTAPHAPVLPGVDTRLTSLDWLALLLVLIGGVDWGLVGIFRFDVIAWLVGPMSTAARVIYALVGIAALYCLLAAPGWRRERRISPD